ncbi:MAG: hypothetical protein KIT84_36945 [Labilithrix sp.]|nr:hypothetical protein [Labilithrix sp.]MCW5816645.1 hypothetical protein [Labilithrix sp.]
MPKDFAFADTVVALDEEIPTAPLSRPPPSQRPREERRTGPPPPRLHNLADPPTLPVPVHPNDPHAMAMQADPHAMAMQADPHAMHAMPMDDPHAMPVDAYGQPIDPYGQPVDAYGQPIDPYGHALPMIAAAPDPMHDPGLVTRSRSAFERARNNVATARHEMKELWGATYDETRDARLANEEDPFVRLAGKLRRLRSMWAFFEWDQDDKMKALGIGIVVFAIVALAFFLTRP